MKSILTSIVILVILLSTTTTNASEPVWEIVKLKDDNFIMYSYIDMLSSFNSDHLFSVRSMMHIFVKDKNPIPLIYGTDWDTYLHDISYKSDTAIVAYGSFFNFVTHPLTEYTIVFYVLPKDTVRNHWNEYKWDYHGYDQGVLGNHDTKYSNVNAEGNGILVIREWSSVKKLTNWVMTDYSSISGYSPLFGVFHNDAHFVVCKADKAGYVLMKSNTGADWVSVGEIADKDDTREKNFNKLLIRNDSEFYVIGEKGFYYSKDAGQNWEYLKVTDNIIKGADFRNDSELFLCGSSGFLCKVNIENNETTYFESLTFYDLYSIHFPEPNVGWAGGDYMTLLKYSTTVNVDEQINHDLSDLRIIPNPASDYVDIYVGDELFEIENNTVEIKSILGIVMTKQNIDIRSENSMLKRLDISKFPQGIYFVKFGNKIEKFIKI